jgi:hypothetical protein
MLPLSEWLTVPSNLEMLLPVILISKSHSVSHVCLCINFHGKTFLCHSCTGVCKSSNHMSRTKCTLNCIIFLRTLCKRELIHNLTVVLIKIYNFYIVTFLSDRRRGIGLSTGFIGLQCTITVTAYHNVLPLQHSSGTQQKAGNGSSACVPLQHSSGIPCHQFITASVSILDLCSWSLSPKTQTQLTGLNGALGI